MREYFDIAGYCRISVDEEAGRDNVSIENQKAIIQDYVRRTFPDSTLTFYEDRDRSGYTFEQREGYQELRRKLMAHKYDILVVKDFSRFSRRNSRGLVELEDLRDAGLRIISIGDGIDFPNDDDWVKIQFQFLMNEMPVTDTSRKVRSVVKRRQEDGRWICAAPYGYIVNKQQEFEVVPTEAEIVRKIFDWYENGMSASSIAKRLNAMQIMTPGDFKIRDGCKSFITHDQNSSKLHAWTTTTIATILKNEVYIGNMVQGKHKSVSYRSKKMMLTDESEWTVVEGTHAPIISDEQFAIIHERFARRTRISPGKTHVYPLSGLVSCGACGHRMNRVVSQGYARYRCMTRTYAPDKCQCPSIKEEYLEELILQTLQSLISRLVDVKAVIDAARQFKTINGAKNEYMLALNKAKREQERLQDAQFHLYDDLQSGLIPKTQYLQFQKRYETEITSELVM